MVTDKIKNCRKCELYINQSPLLDIKRDCQVFWVGLSAKKITSDSEIPLSPNTNTGMIIQKIEQMCPEIITYKTNLVKCLPLTDQQKLRYPNKKEIDCCFENLVNEIHTMSPRIVFLLGEKVYSSVGRHFNIQFDKWDKLEYHYKEHDGTYFVPIHHPSYIYLYRRKEIDNYVKSIVNLINDLVGKE